MKIRLALLVILMLTSGSLAKAQLDIAKLRVDSTPVSSPNELVKQSSLVVLGTIQSHTEEYEMNQTVQENYQLVNYVQTLKVRDTITGSGPSMIRLLITGTDPLPRPPHPLNKIYPGPLAEGDYVCFLRKVPNTNLYTLIGGWQGVYPYLNGRTVALGESGFSQFSGVTIEQLKQIIRSME